MSVRPTPGSWQAATGAGLPMIGRTLAHKNVSTTAIYARLNLDPVRESTQKATTAMMAAGGLPPLAQITSIGKKKRAGIGPTEYEDSSMDNVMRELEWRVCARWRRHAEAVDLCIA